MTSYRTVAHNLLAAAIVFSLVLPTPVLAAANNSVVAAKDVRLTEVGQLTTRIVDGQGVPVAGASIQLEYKQQIVATTTTDKNGYAAFSGLRPGLHTIVSPASRRDVRLWTNDTAPPSAITVPAVVSELSTLRGQFGAFHLPAVIYAGLATAALVVAVDAENSADDADAAAKDALAQIAALEDRLDAHENASP
ncbi:MAG: carboxypeptidase-like regulatory domain-containing protein [Planctomycetaceae bacterium]